MFHPAVRNVPPCPLKSHPAPYFFEFLTSNSPETFKQIYFWFSLFCSKFNQVSYDTSFVFLSLVLNERLKKHVDHHSMRRISLFYLLNSSWICVAWKYSMKTEIIAKLENGYEMEKDVFILRLKKSMRCSAITCTENLYWNDPTMISSTCCAQVYHCDSTFLRSMV